MKERPIIFSTDMVQAILDGRKTMTRRPVKPQPDNDGGLDACNTVYDHNITEFCPYGQPGDRLWVRETCEFLHWAPYSGKRTCDSAVRVLYRADSLKKFVDYPDELSPRASELEFPKVKPSIYMPRWASRINLEIINVGAERLQELSEVDFKKEGFRFWDLEFADYWNSLYTKKPELQWEANPWVWVMEFKNCPTNADISDKEKRG